MVKQMEESNQCDGDNMVGLRTAFSPDFEKFISGQPEYIQAGMKSIYESGKKEMEATIKLYQSLSSVPNDMFTFRQKLERALYMKNATESQEKEAVKCRELADKATITYEQAKSKPDQKYVEKAELSMNVAKTKADTESQKAETMRREYEQFIEQNKKEFPYEFATLLIGICEARIKKNSISAQVAQEILDSVQSLHECEDPVVPKLRERLEQWGQEVIP